MLTVRQAALADKPAIFDFIRKAYADRDQFKIPERWQWQFQQNPFANGDELPIWIAINGNAVIGQSCAMLEPIKIGNEELTVGWSVDTFVLPEYRGQGIGTQLQRANQKRQQLFMSLSMSRENARVKKKLGALQLAPISLYHLRLNASPDNFKRYLSRTSKLIAKSGFSRLASSALNVISHIRWQRRSAAHRDRLAKLDIRQVERFDSVISSLWKHASSSYDMIVRRDARYLNWKFVDQPHMNHFRFVVFDRGEIRGLLVLRRCHEPEPNLGVIVDLFASPSDTPLIHQLTVFAVDFLQALGVDSIKVAASTKQYESVFSSLGFKLFRKLTPLCHFDSKIATSFSPRASAFFSYGDQDLNQYPLMN